MAINNLKPPQNVKIDFSPSPRQYELWRLLQPNYCTHCGGEIIQVFIGYDVNHNQQFVPECKKCHSRHLPQLILGGGSAGGGKATKLTDHVCTPYGFKQVSELKVGDKITSATTGGIQEIIALHPIGEFEFYRIHFIDGTFIECSEGHLWQLHQSRKRTKRRNLDNSKNSERVWTTEAIFKWMEKKKSGMYKACNLIVPLCAPVKFAINNPTYRRGVIDPYVLGALLGDGSMGDSLMSQQAISLTSADQEIVDRFIQAGIDMSRAYKAKAEIHTNYIIKDKNVIEAIKQLGLAGHTSGNKFIPKLFKYATIEERKELMQGLMDTDGYVDDRGHMSYTSISPTLAEDVAFVVRSLGGKATIKKGAAAYKDKNGNKVECQDAYTVYIMTKFDPELVHIKRKKDRCRYEFNGGYSELGKRITDIERIGKRTGRCITVDEPCGLYVADNFTVTHNSYVGSVWLISSCIRFDNIRAVVARKTLKSLKESTWNTIKSIIKDWGLKEGVNYKINNLEGTLTFWNDSVIIMKEMADIPSDPNFERFGSSEYTVAFIDEVSEISEKAVEVLFSRLRWRTHETFMLPRMLLTTNPTINWVRSRFVQDENGDKVVCREGEAYIPFSVFDNPNIAFRQLYEASLNKIRDQATKERLLYGNWDFVEANDMAIYNKFDGAKHLITNLKEENYDPSKPLITVWDFNVAPQMSVLTAQIDYEKKKVYILEEILGKPENKENNTPALSRRLRGRLYRDKHVGGVDVTGDPAGLQRSTVNEDGVNNYTVIMDTLGGGVLRPKLKLMKKQPPQVTRCDFVNELFSGYQGWEVLIDIKCRKLTEDLIYQLKNDDGTKSKQKVTDPKTGTKYEKYGHLSDCLDYLLCFYLRDSWYKFKSGDVGNTVLTTAIMYEGFNY